MSEQSATVNAKGHSAALPVPRRWPRRQILLGVVILLCGIAIGASAGSMFTRKVTRDRILWAWLHPRRTHTMLVQRIQERLHLSPEQTKQVEQIVQPHLERVRAIMDQARPQVYAEFDEMKAEVAQVLNEDQAREWDERFGELLRGHRSSHDSRGGSSGDDRGSDRGQPETKNSERPGDAKDRPTPPPVPKPEPTSSRQPQ